MEIFKEIKGFEDYEVSNYGNIKPLKRNIILSKSIINGYYYTSLYKDGKTHSKRVNRLVAEAFIPNPDNLPCVNHKDENKLNNHVDNLEWCTYKYNSNYGTRNERIGKASAINHKGKKLSEEIRRKISESHNKPVVAVDSEGNVVYEFASTKEAGCNGFNQQHVSECCNGKRKTNKGYRWFFKSDWEK